jgi:hypothetical protein
MTIFPNSSVLKNARLAIGVSAITLIILFGMYAHEVIYYTIIKHVRTGSSICVANFDVPFVSIYRVIQKFPELFGNS